MSKKLKITTIISDEETGDILTKQESIISVDEYIPKNHFSLKNAGYDLSQSDHIKEYGTINDQTCVSHDSVYVSGVVNDKVTASCEEFLKDFSNLSELEKNCKVLDVVKKYEQIGKC